MQRPETNFRESNLSYIVGIVNLTWGIKLGGNPLSYLTGPWLGVLDKFLQELTRIFGQLVLSEGSALNEQCSLHEPPPLSLFPRQCCHTEDQTQHSVEVTLEPIKATA